jgi:hypothetical protein
LADAISRVGSTAQESGVGIDQLNAAVTSAQQTTGRGGAVIGNALKTIFSRLRRPEVIDQLKDLGVAVKDQNGFLLNGIDVLKNYVAATQNLTEAEKAKSSEILGGIHQINVLNSLLNDVSKSNGIYARSLDASVNSTDEAIKKNEKLNESLSAILQKTSVLAQQKAVQYGSQVVQPLIKRGTSLTNQAFELLGGDSEKNAEKEGLNLGEKIAKGIGNALAGPGLLLAGGIILGIGKRLSTFLFEASKSLLGITSESDKLLHLEQAISNTLKTQPELLDLFLKKEITRANLEQSILQIYQDQHKKLEQIKDISRSLAPKGRTQGYEATADYGVIKKKGRASGYLPDGFSQEVSQARSMGASSSVKPMVVNATINGKTGPVIANSEEQIIPNFAGSRETAIIPRYRKMQDIPRMALGHIPNFANADRAILREVISINRLNMSTDEFADPAKNGMSSVLHRGVSGISKRWKKIDRNDPEAVKKAIFTQIDYSDEVPGYDPKKAFMGSSFESLVDSHRSEQLSSSDLSGHPKPRNNGYNNSLPFLSTSKTRDAARWFSSNGLGLMDSVKFRNSRILGNEKLYESLYAKYGKNKVREVLYRQSKVGGGKGLGLDFNDAYRKSSTFEDEREVGLFSGGRVPNFAKRKLSEGASGSMGTFYDLGRKSGGVNVGTKVFRKDIPEYRARAAIAREFLAARELLDLEKTGSVSPIWKSPKLIGTLERALKRKSIGKEAMVGYRTQADLVKSLPNELARNNLRSLFREANSYLYDQVSASQIGVADLGPSNVMVNPQGQKIFTDIANSKNFTKHQGRFLHSQNSDSKIINSLLRRMARRGARLSVIDPGEFTFAKGSALSREFGEVLRDGRASGYIPNFAKKDKYKFPSIPSAKMEANIGKSFEKLTPENQKYFARAYEDYNNLIKVFSKASGTSPEKFANVMSALSPANPLERNALDALRYNLFYQKKLSTAASPIFIDEREIGSVKAQTYGANRTKAANLLVGLEKLTGNKRKSFVNNMLDPFQSTDVTVDYRAQGDALNKQFNVKSAPSMNRKQYDKVSQAFRNVGSKAGVSGLGVQAATWIGGRIGSKAARGQDFNRGILKFFYDNPDKISLENLEFLLRVPRKGKARKDFFKNASAMGVSKLGSDSLISIPRAGGYVPNFAGFNLSTIRFLTKASAKMSGSVLSPKTLIKFATGKGKVEDLVNPFLDFLKKPVDLINSPQDLEDAKSVINLIFKNNQAREMAASRLAPIINESSFSVKSQEEAVSTGIQYPDGGRDYRDYRDFLRYRLLGGQKEYEEYVGNEYDPKTLIKNKDGSYRFNPKSTQGQLELSDVREAAKVLFSTPEQIAESRALMVGRDVQKQYKARKLGPEDNVPGSNPFLGYTYKLGRFIGNVGKKRKAVKYTDRWDVELHQGERDVMENFLKNTSGISDLETRKQVANFYIDRDLSDSSYAGDINSLIVKELLSSIPGANPILLKGAARAPKGETIFAKGYIPNLSGLSDAVSREKTALAQRGVPASQIMAHFDGGGNPIAVTNKIDEPNGLKDVPNFAKKTKKQKPTVIGEDSKLKQIVESYVFNALGSLAPSVASGFANEENVDVTSSISKYAPLAIAAYGARSAFKKAGGGKAGVGAAALSAIGSVPSVISGYFQGQDIFKQVQGDKLQKEIDKSIKQFTLLTENLSGLSQTLTSLDEAYSDPNIDPRIIAKLFKKQQDQLEKAIKANPGAASSILAAGTAKQKQQALADSLEEAGKQQNVSGKVFEYQSADPKKQTAAAFQSLIDGIISQVDTSKISKEDLKGGDIKTILASAGLDKNPQAKSLFADPKVADYFTKALGVSKKTSELTEKLISDTKEIRKPVQALINSNESKRTVRRATSEALSSGLDSIEKFSSSFGERANISAGRDIGLAKKQIALDSRFQIGVGAKIGAAPEGAFKDSLKKNIQDKAFSPDLLTTLNKTLPENATPKEKEVFGQIKGLLEEILREDQTNTAAANAQTSVQLKTLAIQERLTFGGGIKTSIDAGARVDSAKQTLRGALQYQLGGTMGSSATQTAGLANFAASLKDKYPGLLEGSKSINGIEKKLTDLKFSDLRKSLLRDARTAGSIGQGGLAGDLMKGFNDIPGLRKIANTQARQGLGLAPAETGESISEARRFGRYNSVQQGRESEAVANAEKGIEPQVGPKNEIYQKAVKDLQDSLSNALSGLGEIKINGNPVINISGNASGSGVLGNLYQQGKNALGLGSGEVTQAKGFIPNFASPLQDAVNREKSALSKRGIDAVPNFAKINVGQSRKLMNGSNPMGLAVTNSIDEPRGLASIGLASGGYIPNFARTLYGERKASAGLALAKKGKLWAMEYNQDEPNRFFRILENGRIGAEGTPNPTDRVISGFPVDQGKAFLKLGSGKSIPKSLESSLAGGSILKATGVDSIIRAVRRKGGTASDLRNAIEELAQKEGLGSEFVIKTGLGGMSSQGKGVFGVPKQALDEKAYEKILKSYGKKGNKSSDFFIQRKANLSQDYTESRIHVAIDKKGNVTLVKKASLEKHKGELLEDSAFRRAAEKTALQTGKAFAKKNRGIQQILGVDVSAVSSSEGARLGLKTPTFGGFFGKTYQTLVHEINPSDPLGSSGFLSVQNAFSKKFSGVAKGNTLEQFVRGILGTHNQIEIQEHLDKRSQEFAYGEALRQGEGRASGRSDYDQIMRKARKAGLTEEQIAKNLSRGRSSFLGALETSKPDISRGQFKTAFKTGSFDKGVYEAYKAAIASGDLEKASQIASGSKAPSALSSKIGGGLSKLSKLTDKIPSSVRKFGGVGFRGLGAVGEGAQAYGDAGEGDLFGALTHGATSIALGLGKTKAIGPLAVLASAAKLLKDPDKLKARNYSFASDFSDILSGSEEDGGGGFGGAFGVASNALFLGKAGLAMETAKIAYRAGNVLESKGKLGDKLAEIGGYTSGEDRLAKFGYGRSITKKDVIEGRESASEFIKQKRLYLEQTLGANSGRISSILNEDLSQIQQNKSGGFVPNFSFAREKMSIMSNPDYAGHRNAVPNYSKHYSNVVKNSAEIEVPATEVYNRMGLFGAKPKNSSEQYAILNPAQQKSLGYAQGFVPNFAGNDFMEKLSASITEAISSAFEGGMPQGNSSSNVVHINDNSSYHGASQVGSIKKFLMDQFPKELGKYGPDFLAS